MSFLSLYIKQNDEYRNVERHLSMRNYSYKKISGSISASASDPQHLTMAGD